MNDEPIIERNIKGALRFVAFWLLIFACVPVQFFAHFFRRRAPYLMEHFIYRNVARILNMRVRVWGHVEESPSTLYVANHASYLDVPALGTVFKTLFVAKSEVAHWPLFGFLTRYYGTLYVERRAARAAVQKDVLREKLEEGWRILFFPEGTSTDGLVVLPFKSSLFAIAEKPLPVGGYIHVQPVSVVFSAMSGIPAGRTLRPLYAWIGDMTLMKHLWTAFCLGHFTIDVIAHPAQSVATVGDRKKLAAACYRAVSYGVSTALAGRPAVYDAERPDAIQNWT